MKAILISDTHGHHEILDMYLYDPTIIKDCDLIIHAGDSANSRDGIQNLAEQWEFIDWYTQLPFKYKIYVPGNHNTSEHMFTISDYMKKGITRLINETCIVNGNKIYGSPYTPSFGNGWSYNVDRTKMQRVWDMIPKNTDILVTHGPPAGILDLTKSGDDVLRSVGCKSLLNTVFNLDLKLHVFGHLHDESNIYNHGVRILNNTIYANASIVDLHHRVVNQPIIIEL